MHRHNEFERLWAVECKKVFNDVELEPQLQPLEGEVFEYRSAVVADDARSVLGLMCGCVGFGEIGGMRYLISRCFIRLRPLISRSPWRPRIGLAVGRRRGSMVRG